MVSRRTADFMERINAAARSAPAADATPAPSPAAPREAGFVGKVLAESNKSLDAQIEEATREAAASKAEAAELRATLESGALAVHVDPRRVRVSQYPDRHPCAFHDAEFLAFVDEIKATGGNQEPGIVRPIKGDPDHDYELAAGHRRHQACLVTALPFFCFVRELTDEELFVSMVTENKGRKDLSSFERGRHYAKLLADNKFDSLRKMAEAINEPRSVMHRLVAYGDLPDAVIEAFSDPRCIRSGWVAPLVEAYQRHPDEIEAEARAVREASRLTPNEVFKRLTGVTVTPTIVAGSDRVLASVRMIHDRKAIVLYKGAPDDLLERLKEVIEAYHQEHEEPAS